MNTYLALYKSRKIMVQATTSYEAQTKAAITFKAKKQYEVSVYLHEKDGETVVHSTSEI